MYILSLNLLLEKKKLSEPSNRPRPGELYLIVSMCRKKLKKKEKKYMLGRPRYVVPNKFTDIHNVKQILYILRYHRHLLIVRPHYFQFKVLNTNIAKSKKKTSKNTSTCNILMSC